MIFQQASPAEFDCIRNFYWNLIDMTQEQNDTIGEEKRKKTIRLDILGTNSIAEKLYVKCGFRFVQAKPMFYEDTGWTEYKMYEKNLHGED